MFCSRSLNLYNCTSCRDTEAQSGNFNSFFLDLYDDIGFDPFMESSKALADLLEEEKTAGSMS